ncbi:ABC-type transporter, integral membrane subunit [Thalassoporum mexicanum PCC 7367]|uniref:ABC transporter permease n=1 Tax=Thalassoporum mexicanum TaxID=3457544 RepID=UPI00029F8488|nr:ABC transporter permease [Pseudanabaena sp. PCC 7367]AFY69767.1 ABC-type transporter, integral membrane subunit [Pseudanabaena sp. PCC 7367]
MTSTTRPDSPQLPDPISNPNRPPSRLSKLIAPLAFLAPGGSWLILFLILPALLLLIKSFVTPTGSFTLTNYSRIFAPNEAGDLIYLAVIWRSLLFSGITTALCLLIGFPVAYWIAVIAPKRWQNALLLAFVLPLWTSSLLRAYAWISILRRSGLLNSILVAIGLPRLNLLDTPAGAIIGMVYSFLPYMVLVLFSSLEKLDLRLLEAAADLGANARQTFVRITIPQVVPGIVAGCALVAITSFADYINPAILGGINGSMISYFIERQFLGPVGFSGWGFGSALSMILILGVSIIIALLIKFGDRSAVKDV